MRRNNNATRRRPIPQVTALRNEMLGYSFTPAEDPSTIAERPYNQIVLEFTNLDTSGQPSTNVQQIKVEDVLSKLNSVVGVGTGVRFKVRRAAAYATAVGPSFLKPTIRFSAYELRQASSATARINLSDSGDLNCPARAGYHWPINDTKEVLTSADNDTLIVATTGAISSSPVGYTSQLIRLYVLWR